MAVQSITPLATNGHVPEHKLVTITVDGREVKVAANQTLLAALREAGVDVPTLCHRNGLHEAGACRICVVEVQGSRTLVASCSQPVADGMVVRTHTPRVRQARKVVLELQLANHPDNCLTCQRNNDCELQTLAAEYGVERRFRGKRKRECLDVASYALVRDAEKCVLCQRCVSVCEDIQSVGAISPLKRGFDTVIGVAFGELVSVEIKRFNVIFPAWISFELSHPCPRAARR
jgi:NADH-quinone oxidoreductase subunit G/NADP-reducing hydrogenase subunit HndD